MKRLTLAFLVVGLTVLCGCASSVPQGPSGRLLKLNCVVEQYDPEQLVFYGLDTLPYDARSRVCLLKVLGPAKYRDRRIAVDLHGEKEKKDEPWMYLRMVGAHVRISIHETDLPEDPKQMIPVEALTEAEPVDTGNAGKASLPTAESGARRS